MKNIIILTSVLFLLLGLSNCSEEYDDTLIHKNKFLINSSGDSVVIASKWPIVISACRFIVAGDTTQHNFKDEPFGADISEDWFTTSRIDSTDRRSFYVKVDANDSKEIRKIVLNVFNGPLYATVFITQEGAE